MAVRERLLDIVHRRLAEIARENGEGQPIRLMPEEKEEIFPPRISFSVGRPSQLSKEELVEKFIREEPKISSPRTAFLRPNAPVENPERDDDEIVSETLAILFYKQGNMQKAIKVYEKLRLLFPEKSGYFAARIEELKKANASGAQRNGGY